MADIEKTGDEQLSKVEDNHTTTLTVRHPETSLLNDTKTPFPGTPEAIKADEDAASAKKVIDAQPIP